jgi:hypothetical protein
MQESLACGDAVMASFHAGHGQSETVNLHGRYDVKCFSADGALLWEEVIENLVTTVGKNDILDKYLAGAAYTPTLFMGLKGTGAAVIGDTQVAHASWLEVGGVNAPAYSGTRKTPTFSPASGALKTTSAVVTFTFTSPGTVYGAFLNNGGTSAIDNTTGILYSVGDFTTPQPVISGNSVQVTYTAGA